MNPVSPEGLSWLGVNGVTYSLTVRSNRASDLTALPVSETATPLAVNIDTQQSNYVAPPEPVRKLFDDSGVGGKFTIFVLLYGDFHELHKRCLNAILDTCDKDRIELRIGSNELCADSVDFVQSLGKKKLVHSHDFFKKNRGKYPVMRDMFHDASNPITTKWVIWFDDDSICNKNPDWLALLADQIVKYPRVDMFGPHRVYNLQPSQQDWVRKASWYTGKPFRDASGKGVTSANKVHFCVGAFWAMRTAAITKADIPCNRLRHNGGDWTIGEQLWQNDLLIRNWCGDKAIVDWSSVERRGKSETHPGLKT